MGKWLLQKPAVMTSKADVWLEGYGESHQNPVNKLMHWICVPMIVLSIVGGLWAIPMPTSLTEVSPLLNLGTAFLACSLIYYFTISWSLALGMLPVVAATVMIVGWLDRLPWPLAMTSLMLFVFAWIGQFWGHWIEGKKPSFLKDLQYLMIGPLWMLAAVFRRFGLKY